MRVPYRRDHIVAFALMCALTIGVAHAQDVPDIAPHGICSFAQVDLLQKLDDWNAYRQELKTQRDLDRPVDQYLLRSDVKDWVAQIAAKFAAKAFLNIEIQAWDAEIEALYDESDPLDGASSRIFGSSRDLREQMLTAYVQKQEPLFRDVKNVIESDILGKNLRATRPEAVRQIEQEYGRAILNHVKRFEAGAHQRALLAAIKPLDLASTLWSDMLKPAGRLLDLLEQNGSEQQRIEQRELRSALRQRELMYELDAAKALEAAACTAEVSVNARARHTLTQLSVTEGDCVRVTTSSRAQIIWTQYQRSDVLTGPAGTDLERLFGPDPAPTLQGMQIILGLKARPLPDENPGALIGTIIADDATEHSAAADAPPDPGESWFYIGTGGAFRMPASGELALGVNDAHLTNNAGAFRVTVYRTNPLLEIANATEDVKCGNEQ
jgi:hypothetical protein